MDIEILNKIDQDRWESLDNYQDRLSYIKEINENCKDSSAFYVAAPDNAQIEGAESIDYDEQERKSNERIFNVINDFFKKN